MHVHVVTSTVAHEDGEELIKAMCMITGQECGRRVDDPARWTKSRLWLTRSRDYGVTDAAAQLKVAAAAEEVEVNQASGTK